MKALLLGLVLSLAVSSAWAEEVLICTDSALGGYLWDENGDVVLVEGAPERFAVTVVSETERWIEFEGMGQTWEYRCFSDYVGRSHCAEEDGFNTQPIVFGTAGGFTRAMLNGPPLGEGSDRSIYLAYGTCTPF
jgi:hypothetical protein